MAPALLDCVVETSADSALAQRLLQSGPADAQGQDLEEEQEDACPVAHATEEGAKNEQNSTDHRVLLCVCVVCVLLFSSEGLEQVSFGLIFKSTLELIPGRLICL